jgi:hypothetical protein
MSAIPMGIPGCPDFASCTASADKTLIQSANFFFSILMTGFILIFF